MFDRLLILLTRISRCCALCGGALILLSAFMVTVDVLARRFFDWNVGGADELSGYALAIATAWALPYCLLLRANVRVDALYNLLGTRIRACLDILGLGVLSSFISLLTFRGGLVLLETIEMSARAVTPLRTPLVIPQSIWVCGLVLYLFTLAAVLLRGGSALIKGDLAKIDELAGTSARSAEDRNRRIASQQVS